MTTTLGQVEWYEVDRETGQADKFGIEPVYDVQEKDNEGLVSTVLHLGALSVLVGDLLREIRLELRLRMEREGATQYVGPAGTAELKELGVSYEPTVLDTLLEHLPEAELVEAQALVPEHEETTTVPRRWNVTKLKPFGKRGRVIQEIIEESRVVGGHRVEVKSP